MASEPLAAQAAAVPRLFRNPSMTRDQIAFALGDALWTVSRAGGVATRVSTPGLVRSGPFFSPNGQFVAYSAAVNGATDVYVLDVKSGGSHRVTWHPNAESVLGWTPDGKDVLFTMNDVRSARLYHTAMSGNETPQPLPMPTGSDATFSPDGNRLAYSPVVRPVGNRIPWKQYRAGGMSHIAIANLKSLDITNISGETSNDVNPMWVGSRVYFLSDRDGPVTLYAYDEATGAIQRLIDNSTFDFKSASAGPGGIVYEQLGGIYTYDFATRRATQIPITVRESDLPDTKSREIGVPASQAADITLSPNGDRIALSARGEVFIVASDSGTASRNLSSTTTLREHDPTWSPDGAQLAYFQDSLGIAALVFRRADGSDEPRRVPLAGPAASSNQNLLVPTEYGNAHWSPDGMQLLYSDGQALWLVATAGGAPMRLGNGSVGAAPWSPDSKWFAFVSGNRVRLRAVDGRTMAVTDGTIQVTDATFDPTGQYVYFLGSLNRNSSSIASGMSFNLATTVGAYVAPLKRGMVLPSSQKESWSPTQPDSGGLTDRVSLLPVPMGNYSDLIVDPDGNLYVGEGAASVRSTPYTAVQGGTLRALWRFAWSDSSWRDVMTGGLSAPQLSRDGTTLLYQQGTGWRTMTTAQLARGQVKPSSGRRLAIRGLTMRTDPMAEWTIMYKDAWRGQRDLFYDGNFHGLDMAKADSVYAAFLPGLASRSDLTYLMREMLTNMSVGHISVGEPPAPTERGAPSEPNATTGLLGIDVVQDSGRYRIARIYRGDPWVAGQRGPLAAPGIDVRDGEYLIDVNGKPLSASDNFYRAFDGTAGRPTKISVGNASARDARQITVTPTGSEDGLRTFQWVQDNIRRVDSLSRGRIAYIYMPNTQSAGWDSFLRYYLQQNNRAGIIIDERNNGGGDIAEFPLMILQRTPLIGPSFGRGRTDDRDTLLTLRTPGPRAMIINEVAASGGDIMPFMFRQGKMGALVGTRTYGIAIGNAGVVTMLDGGNMRVPRGGVVGFGEWGMEGVGVPPDIEVTMNPKAVAAGHDPQLEAAVANILHELEKRPVVQYKRPPPIQPSRKNGLDRKPPADSSRRRP